MPKRLKICHDRILPQDMHRPMRMMSIGGGLRAVMPDRRKRWPNGSTLRVRFLSGTQNQIAKVKEQANWWTDHANLMFDFSDALDAEIRITFNPSLGAWSYVGTDCSYISQGEPTMNLGFLDGGTACHEFGHAIGLGHEHQNPEGGIEWNEEVVIRDLSGPPNNWTPDQIRQNVLEKYSKNQYLSGTEFDPDSIMLYFFPGTWTKSGQGTKANDVMSQKDKEFISNKEGYPRDTAKPVEVGVNAPAVSAEIGVPGEEDLFSFKAEGSGRHVIETGGQTDVVMKLYGPDSPTLLIAEDDDGGVGLNARITADLAPGQYLVQIRHYNRSGGTGSYSLSVSA
ncbi:MAG: M12 family metallopeptidase [Chloroflexota bacterium]